MGLNVRGFTSKHKILTKFVGYLQDKRGQALTEYILILSLIALIVLTSLTPLGSALAIKYTEITAEILDIE